MARALVASAASSLACAALACATIGSSPADDRSARRQVVVWFADYNEVLHGSADLDQVLRMGFVDLRSATSGARCVGPALTLHMPPEADPPRVCDGLGGKVELNCSDRRQMRATWRSGRQCGAGYGKGEDQYGHVFRLAYGMSAETAKVMTREALAELAGRPPLPAPDEAEQTQGPRSGTAFFVTRDGHLITNHHVIDGAKRIQVALDDEDVLDVDVVAQDEKNDLALLRVAAIRPVLPIRRNSELGKGQEVFTLGYPLLLLQGREQKATFGRINALTGIQGDERYAQIDVPIQPGNSGGPLLNTRGQVVGVVTSMLSPEAAIAAAGVVPQNVNYALKSEILHELLRYTLGSELFAEQPDPPKREFRDLVEKAQESVVIVLAQ